MSIPAATAPSGRAATSTAPSTAPQEPESVGPFRAADVPVVAALYRRVFERTGEPPGGDLRDHLAGVFLRGASADADLPSLVVRRGEAVIGFMGCVPLRFAVDGRERRAALASTIMVDPERAGPLAGARLMRTFLAGPQDLSLGETASETTEAMWRHCGGETLALYSLDWMRVINPAALAAGTLSERLASLGALAPAGRALAAWVDGRLRRRRGASLRWSGHGSDAPAPRRALDDGDADPADIAAAAQGFVQRFAARPVWSPEAIARIVRDGASKRQYGEAVHRLVRDRRGTPVGAYILHGRAGRQARVVQFFAEPGAEEGVVDAMMALAAERGFTALRGRAQPWQLAALTSRRCVFFKSSASMGHARDPRLLAAFRSGEAFFTGYAGEGWLRLIGDTFD
ncbi:MAG: GNAT family N-acetyltransferase [Methylobacterium frigidaeris]